MTLAPPASAHLDGSAGVKAVLDRVEPELPGVAVEVATTQLGSQFIVDNPTPTELTILSEAGDPFLRIGPGGVLGNFRSPAWYTSKTPEGFAEVPRLAYPGRAPLWVRVSPTPQWGWFDHRLHNAEPPPSLADEQRSTRTSFGAWQVGIRYGEQPGEVRGHYETEVRLGNFTAELTPAELVPGVALSVVAGGAEGLLLANTAGRQITVLGAAGEPFLRMTPRGTEANEASPSWHAAQRARGGAAPTTPADPTAPPTWLPVSEGLVYAWVDPRAAPPPENGELSSLTEPTTVKEWTIPFIVDGTRVEARGSTTFLPAPSPDDGGFGRYVTIGLVIGVVVLAGLLVVLLRSRRRAAT